MTVVVREPPRSAVLVYPDEREMAELRRIAARELKKLPVQQRKAAA